MNIDFPKIFRGLHTGSPFQGEVRGLHHHSGTGASTRVNPALGRTTCLLSRYSQCVSTAFRRPFTSQDDTYATGLNRGKGGRTQLIKTSEYRRDTESEFLIGVSVSFITLKRRSHLAVETLMCQSPVSEVVGLDHVEWHRRLWWYSCLCIL